MHVEDEVHDHLHARVSTLDGIHVFYFFTCHLETVSKGFYVRLFSIGVKAELNVKMSKGEFPYVGVCVYVVRWLLSCLSCVEPGAERWPGESKS